MKRWLPLLLLGFMVPAVWAGTPRTVPPLDDTLLRNFLKSIADHLNTLECLSANPDGTLNPPGMLGRHGELKCAAYGGTNYICMNTSSGPSAGTDWSCLNVESASGTITVQSNDSTVDPNVTTLDFSTKFSITSSPSGEANIDLSGILAVQKNDVDVDTNVSTLDVSPAFTATSSPAGEANIGLAGGTPCTSFRCWATYWNHTGSNPSTIDAMETNGANGIAFLGGAGATGDLWVGNDTFSNAGSPAGTTGWFIGGGSMGADAAGIVINDTTSTLTTEVWHPPAPLISSLQWSAVNPSNAIHGAVGGVVTAFTHPTSYSNINPTRGYVYGLVGVGGHRRGSQPINNITGLVGMTDSNTLSGSGTINKAYGVDAQHSGTGGSTTLVTEAAGLHTTSVMPAITGYGALIVTPTNSATNCGIGITTSGATTCINGGGSASTFTFPTTSSGTIALTTNASDVIIQKADPTLIYDVATATDTDFWAGVQDDAGSDDDDKYQIGDGITPGSNIHLTILTDGNVGIGSVTPATKLDVNGTITGSDVSTGNGAVELAAGQWSPSANIIANLDASSAGEGQYSRVGATVTFSVRVTVDPTAPGSAQVELDLPVASNFGSTDDAAGTCFAPGIAAQGAAILADTGSDELEMRFIAADLTSQAMYCSGSYQLI